MQDNVQSKKLKFLHCSDVHLDAPFLGLSPEKNEQRRRALRNTFGKIMEYVRDNNVNYVLISGDLFDTSFATNSTAEILIKEFRSCPETKFIIAPGKSDAFASNPIYCSGRLPENCFVFSSEKLSRFDFEEDRVTVYGWAFVDGGITESPLRDMHVDDGSKINIVCGYCDLDGDVDSDCCPILKEDVKAFGADYYAFGSHHEKTDFTKIGGALYSYSGSVECMGFENNGLGGIKVLNVDYDGGELSVDGKALSFGKMRFVSETIDITGIGTNSEVVNSISRLINTKKYGMDVALRVTLTGDIDPRFNLSKNLDSESFGLYHFDMVDKTMPLYNTEHFKRDMSVSGEIFRRMLPKLTSDSEEERLLAAKAFRAGLAALEGRDADI